MPQLWRETASRNINTDARLINGKPLQAVKKEIKLEYVAKSLNHVSSLSVQGILVTAIIDVIKPSNIARWSTEVNNLPSTLFCFARKALQQQLATNANLHRWGKAQNPNCSLCGVAPQTNKHVLNNCGSPAALDRYKVRHDAALNSICRWLSSVIDPSDTLHADLPDSNYKPLDTLFKNLRPDIAIVKGKLIILCELTIAHESNVINSKIYKRTKYATINSDLTINFLDYDVCLFTCELTSLGFISDLTAFTEKLSIDAVPDSVYRQLVRSVLVTHTMSTVIETMYRC